MKVVFLFVDGLGVGPEDPQRNPCARESSGFFRVFSGGGEVDVPRGGTGFGLDACLGLPGLPQSATGQTALLTGENAAEKIGRHLSGFPNQPLRELLLEKSVLRQAREKGLRAAFINAYRPLFFELPEEVILRLSATTIANYAAHLPFFTLEDVKAGRAIYQDFTNQALIDKGFDMPRYSPEQAADILAAAADRYDFLLYEYFRTDRAGHKQDLDLAVSELEKYGRFLRRFLEKSSLEDLTVLLTSDHGNLEDLSTKSHTRNPAMTLVWGPGAPRLKERLKSIQDVSSAILELLDR